MASNSSPKRKPRLLVVDQNEMVVNHFLHAFERRGFEVIQAGDVSECLQHLQNDLPKYVLVGPGMSAESRLALLESTVGVQSQVSIVLLSKLASIEAALETIKFGEPFEPSRGERHLSSHARLPDTGKNQLPAQNKLKSMQCVEREHIQKVLARCEGNVSAAAKILNLNRRTLHRKLEIYQAEKLS